MRALMPHVAMKGPMAAGDIGDVSMPGARPVSQIPRVAPPAADFELLLGEVIAPAYGAALRLTRHRQDAEDLVQEASLLAFRAFATFQAGTNFKAWFFRILMNQFYTAQRRRRAETSIDEIEEAQALFLYGRSTELGLYDRTSDPARALLASLTRDDVARALDSLPEEFRVVCTLYFVDDFAYQEIADMIGAPIGTVRSRLHRGRRLLQKELWLLAQDQGIVSLGDAGRKEVGE